MAKQFPDGFLWGASTSAHQVEGGQHNDWTEWENANAERLAREAPAAFSHLASWKHIKDQATDPANYRSGRAAEHWDRFEADLDLAKQLGLSAYRFSVEWSRVEPEEGRFDEAAIAHYRDMIQALRVRHIEPFVTVWHWPLPLWLSQRGGWLAPDAVERFGRYTDKLAAELGGVKFWLTLNEPEVYAGNGFLAGVWPPGRRNPVAFWRVRQRLLLAHRTAYDAIKHHQPEAQVGIAANLTWFEPGNRNPLNRLVAATATWGSSYRFFLDPIAEHQDFIGLNHYFHSRVLGGRLNQNLNAKVSDLGWELLPAAIHPILADLKRRYDKPIYITENGLADGGDRQRAWFIRETLGQIHRAIAYGADVRGYLHWSLLDNFEWDKGFWPRFGLIEVDFKTQKRTVRPSAKVYAEIIKQNGLS